MPSWRIFPATLYDRPHTVLRNNNTDLLTMLVDTASRLIYAAAHKIFGVFRKRAPPLTEINEEPRNVSQEAGNNSSVGVSDEGGNSASINVATQISDVEKTWKQKTFTRSEIQHPTTMENLPNDLLLNIFIRLLAKQVAQMRCVSKYWNALLSESSFVNSHLHHSIHNNDRILMVFYDNSSSSDPKPFTTHPSGSPHLELTNFIKLPLDDPDYGHTTSMIIIIGSVHGLICSCYGNEVIRIWNPSLSAMLTLPPHYIPSRGSYEIRFRFGFDPKTEDYKVVKLIGLTGLSSRQPTTFGYLVKEWLEVEVYSMRKGSWKFITQRFPSHITRICEDDYICVDGHDGHLHWRGCIDEEKKLETIVAFDLGSETFREIPFPDSVVGGERWNVLKVMDGKLCVMSWVTTCTCEVWVMDVYGVAESWVKHHAHTHFLDDKVYGFTSHNEYLIVDDYDRLVLYDPIADKDKILEEFCHRNDSADTFVEYVDSLVWIAPAQLEVTGGA